MPVPDFDVIRREGKSFVPSEGFCYTSPATKKSDRTDMSCRSFSSIGSIALSDPFLIPRVSYGKRDLSR